MTEDWLPTLDIPPLDSNRRPGRKSPAISPRSFESFRTDAPQHSLVKAQIDQIIALSKALNEKELELCEAKRELKSLRRVQGENAALKSKGAALADRIASAERELQLKSLVVSEQELELNDLGLIESDLSYSNRQRDELFKELDSLRGALKRSELAEDQLASEVRQRLQAEERAAILQEEADSSNAKLSAYTRGLEGQLRELDAENEQLRSELMRTSGIIDRCQVEFSSLESLRAEMQLKSDRYLSVSSELERERKALKKLKKSHSGFEARIKDLTTKTDGADPLVYINILKSRLSEAEALHTSSAQEAGQLENRVKAAENKLRQLRKTVRIRLGNLTEWVDEKFTQEDEGLRETACQDTELSKYWSGLEVALMKAKNIVFSRIKDMEKRNRALERNSNKLEDVAAKLKLQLEGLSAKVDSQERLGMKVQFLERQLSGLSREDIQYDDTSRSFTKVAETRRQPQRISYTVPRVGSSATAQGGASPRSTDGIVSELENMVIYSQRRFEELSREHEEVLRILQPYLGDHDDNLTLKDTAKSLGELLANQHSTLADRQLHLEGLKQEANLLKRQLIDEKSRIDHVSKEYSEASKEYRLTTDKQERLLEKKDLVLAAKEADYKKLVTAHRDLQTEVERLQAELGSVKGDRTRVKDLSYQHYKTCVMLLRVLMPTLQNMRDLAAQKAMCSATLHKFEVQIKQFSEALGLTSPRTSRLRVVGVVVRALVRLQKVKRHETVKYSGISLKISPVVPDMPIIPQSDSDPRQIYNLLLSTERSFPKAAYTKLPCYLGNIDRLKRVLSLAKGQVEVSAVQTTTRQQLLELAEDKHANETTIAILKEKLGKLQFSFEDQSVEFEALVRSYAEVKAHNKELEATLTVLQLNTEAVSEQLIYIRNQYTELLADNGLKTRHLEALQGTHNRLQRELEESEDARIRSETERNDLLEKAGILNDEVSLLTDAIGALRHKLE